MTTRDGKKIADRRQTQSKRDERVRKPRESDGRGLEILAALISANGGGVDPGSLKTLPPELLAVLSGEIGNSGLAELLSGRGETSINGGTGPPRLTLSSVFIPSDPVELGNLPENQLGADNYPEILTAAVPIASDSSGLGGYVSGAPQNPVSAGDTS